MRGEGDERDAPVREDVEAIGFDGTAFDASRRCGQVRSESRPRRKEPTASSLFVMDSMSTSARVSSTTFIHSPGCGCADIVLPRSWAFW